MRPSSTLWIRITAWLAVTLVAVPPGFAGQIIDCGSSDGRYTYCRVDTGGSARLVNQESRARCDQGRSWGYDKRGVWVDNGCRGQFEVDYKNDSKDAKVAAVAGLAILGAAIAHKMAKDKEEKEQQEREQHERDRGYDREDPGVPSWAIGTFDGYNATYQKDVRLKVFPSGEAAVYSDGNRVAQGDFNRDITLSFGEDRLRVEPEGSGLRVTEIRNPSNVVHYRRVD